MSPEKKYAPSAIRSEKEWAKTSSRTLYKRSPQLREIDSAVGKYHQTLQNAADNYAKRTALATTLLEKIQTWEKTKSATGQVKSVRASVVAELKLETQEEQDIIAKEKKCAQVLAADSLRTAQQDAAYRPERVAVYSVGMLLNNDGSFAGATAEEYKELKDKQFKDGKASEMDGRLALLKTKLDQAYAEFKQNPDHDDKVLGVFTAPEWLFKNPGVPFTQDEMIAIQDKCLDYSAACPDMLIVPGSTVWTEGSGDTLKLRNTAFAFFNGKLAHETHKRSIAFDETGYEKEGQTDMKSAWNRAKQANQDSSLFMVGNRLLALEICADHGDIRAQKNQLDTYGSGVGTDIHIVVSKGASLSANGTTLKHGGVGIGNDASTLSLVKGGVRAVISAGVREPNPPESYKNSAYDYKGAHKESFEKLDDLKKLYLKTHQLPK